MHQSSFKALKLLLVGLFLCIGSIAFAQKTISGTVKDGNGEPIIGTSIMLVEDATKGTIADENGNFTITVDPGNTLRFSSIGFMPKEIKIGNQTVLDVVLDF